MNYYKIIDIALSPRTRGDRQRCGSGLRVAASHPRLAPAPHFAEDFGALICLSRDTYLAASLKATRSAVATANRPSAIVSAHAASRKNVDDEVVTSRASTMAPKRVNGAATPEYYAGRPLVPCREHTSISTSTWASTASLASGAIVVANCCPIYSYLYRALSHSSPSSSWP